MEEKTLLQSRMIAIFMGSEYKKDHYEKYSTEGVLEKEYDIEYWSKPTNGFPKCAVTGQEWSSAYQTENFKYHCSYDWLMPVWFEFRQLYFDLPEYKMKYNNYIKEIGYSINNINIFFESLCNGIEWYNKTLTEKSKSELLLEEANNKGYKEGVVIKRIKTSEFIKNDVSFSIRNSLFSYLEHDGTINIIDKSESGGEYIYYYGEWAEIIK